MKLIYIAGPYREWQDGMGEISTIAHNIMDAREVAADLVRRLQDKGIFPVTPHLNTAHFERLSGLDGVPDEYWLKGTAELLRRCDGVLLTRPDAGKISSGTRKELNIAEKMGKPIYRTLAELCSCVVEHTHLNPLLAVEHILVPPFNMTRSGRR
ncbi:TPA: hypothetical protein ACGCAJ_004759 [Serratia marcescens]